MQTMAQRAPRAEQAPASRQARGDAVQRKDVESPRGSEASTLAYGRMLHQGPAVQRVAAYQAMADRRPVAQRVTQLQDGDDGGMPSGASWMLGGMGGWLAMNRAIIARAQGGTGLGPLGSFAAGEASSAFAGFNFLRNVQTLMSRGPLPARALAMSPVLLSLFGAGYNASQGGGFWPSSAPSD